MNLSLETRNKLNLIHLLLQEAEQQFSTIPVPEQEEIREFHHEESGLPHALRWGTQGAEEILEASKPKENASGRTFHRRVVLFQTISEESLENLSLNALLNYADKEDAVGDKTDLGNIQVTGQEAAETLSALGSDPSFLQLNEDGKDEE